MVSVNTAYSPDLEHASVMSATLDRLDVKTFGEFGLAKSGAKDWRKCVLDVLGASAQQLSRQTFSYRRRGEDTLTWGDPDDWIQIKWWVQCLFESSFRPACVEQYSALRDIVRTARLRELEEMYSFRDATSVRRFLHTHPRLIEVLIEAYPYLLKLFGPDLRAALEVINDPEAQDWNQLCAYILTSLSVEEALDKLDELDEEWFLDQLDRVNDFLNFDLECI